jgi:hypothetical protein
MNILKNGFVFHTKEIYIRMTMSLTAEQVYGVRFAAKAGTSEDCSR